MSASSKGEGGVCPGVCLDRGDHVDFIAESHSEHGLSSKLLSSSSPILNGAAEEHDEMFDILSTVQRDGTAWEVADEVTIVKLT